MSGTQAYPSFHWSGQAVDVHAIDAALERLRQQTADAAPAEGAALGARTSVLTLVAYALDAAAAQRADETIANLPRYHPSRSIVVLAQPSDDEPAIDAQLSAHCHIAPGLEGQVCFEVVELTVMGRAARHLHSVVLPLLVPDLPVLSWWSGDLPGDTHLLEDMLGASDRFVVDSARLTDAESGLPCLERLVQYATTTAVSDLSWTRVATWRRLIADLFDSPALRPYLGKLTAVDIEHDNGSASEALLLIGWLAARLGWRPEAKKNGTYRLRSGDPPEANVMTTLHALSSPGSEPGSLLAVRLAGSGDATFSVRRSETKLTVHTEAPEGTVERSVRLTDDSDPEMLAQEMEITGRDRAYEEALAMATALLET